ncbi:MAG: RNA-binding protein [Chloroflexi bacterium]|nr:MAG: RNA-binding protein [Chloroflexota bacterium]
MCLAKAYAEGKGEPELLAEDVALMEIEGGQVRLSTLFGETKEIEGVLKRIDFEGSAIYLERAD